MLAFLVIPEIYYSALKDRLPYDDLKKRSLNISRIIAILLMIAFIA